MLLACSCGDRPAYDRYWDYPPVTPIFTTTDESLSTSFTGFVHPQKQFVFGVADGLHFDKPNVRLTVNANVVWQYAPLLVELYDGPRENVDEGTSPIVRWEVPPPPVDGTIAFVDSQPLRGRRPLWAYIDFVDFSGGCVLQILGHD
jgi:hypothetical protein